MSAPRAPKEVSELKIGKGVNTLYLYATRLIENKSIQPDAQGIVSIPITAKELSESKELADELKGQFPTRSKDGLVMHIFTKDLTDQPPIRLMLEARVEGFYKAANKMLEEESKHKLSKMPSSSIEEIDARSEVNKYYESYKNRLAQYKERSLKEASDIAQILGDSKDSLRLKNRVNELDDRIMASLFRASKQNEFKPQEELKEVPKDFQRQLKHILKDTRAFESDMIIVTQNERDVTKNDDKTSQYSYDYTYYTGCEISAHDRSFKSKGAANAGNVVSGKLEGRKGADNKTDEKAATVKVDTSFYIHSTPAPIDEINLLTFTFTSNRKIIEKTKNNIKDIIAQMAEKRLHGGDTTKPMKIEWFYEILTSNVLLEKDFQGKAYIFIAKAIKELEEEKTITVRCQRGPVTINFTGYMVNAGIGSYIGNAYDADTLANNEKAFSRIKQLFGEYKMPTETDVADVLMDEMNSNSQALTEGGLLFEDDIGANRHKLANYHQHIIDLRNAILDEKRYDKEVIIDKKGNKTYQDGAVDRLLKDDKNKEIQNLYNSAYQKAKEKGDTVQMQRIQDQMTAIRLLYDMAETSKLFYSGAYKDPKWAPLFNAYVNNVLRSLKVFGVEASFGCKSANDRTLVQKEYSKVMAPQTGVLSSPKTLKEIRADIDARVMASTVNALADTGSLPKSYQDKFASFKELLSRGLSRFCKVCGEELAFHKVNLERTIGKEELNGSTVRSVEQEKLTGGSYSKMQLTLEEDEDMVLVDVVAEAAVNKEAKYDQVEKKEEKQEKDSKQSAAAEEEQRYKKTRTSDDNETDTVQDMVDKSSLKIMK